MQKKIVLTILFCALVFSMAVVGCAPAKKTGREKAESAKKSATQASTREYKTYVSKYGFSVSYPADWILEEEKHVIMTEAEISKLKGIIDFDKPSPMEYEGFKNFVIKGKLPNGSFVSIELLFINDVLSGSWGSYRFRKDYTIDSLDKLLFLLEKMNQYKVSERGKIDRIIEIKTPENLIIGLIYYQKMDPWQAFFYLPKWDTLAYISIDAGSDVKEILPILKSIRYVSNN